MPLIDRDVFADALSLGKFHLRPLAGPLMWLLRLHRLNKLYDKFKHLKGLDFIEACLTEFKISYDVPENDLKNIPSSGPVIFIANHPYGGLDGIIMLKIIGEKRTDFKVMANFALSKIEPLQEFFIPVDPFENKNSTQRSLSGIKKTLDVLAQGNAIGIFPAGEVSAIQNKSRKITDKTWNPMIGKLVSKSGAKVVPMYFSGSNSLFFNLLGLIHPRLRTARLPSELLNKKNHPVRIRIGKPISAEEIAEFKDNKQLMRFLRAKTYMLGTTLEGKRNYFTTTLQAKAQPEPIIDPVDEQVLEMEIGKIRENDLMTEFQDFELYLSKSKDIPNILREIGRLREITFREVGEGTNRPIDIDEFDLYFHHLFIWDKIQRKIVGAYRVGKGNELFTKYGAKGFYISTLFQIKRGFYPILKHSVELGRSFIVKEYQQKVYTLFLLWRGILMFMRDNPEYRYLIGPVSISNSFLKVSKTLLVYYIKKHYFDHEMAKHIKARKEFKVRSSYIDADIIFGNEKEASMKTIDGIISEMEPMGAKAPVLIRKYLQQNGRIIGFNIDPKFNNAMDGFIIMDMKNAPAETIAMLEKSTNICQ